MANPQKVSSELIALFKQCVIVLFLMSAQTTVVIADENSSSRLISIGDSSIHINFAPNLTKDTFKLTPAEILAWVERSAHAVADYFDGFPVTQLNLAVNPGNRSRVNGVAYNGEQPLIVLTLGRTATRRDLESDWVLVHELVHLGFPPMYRKHSWIEEGLATYVEPIVRVRAGLMHEQDAWMWLVDGVPKGLPRSGDRGLDFTPTWGRKYWGGALFFFMADMQIRQQTQNKYQLQDALRAIKKAGGTMQQDSPWEIARALKIADKATGTRVMMDLYQKMKDKPAPVNLDKIWKQLGVKLVNGKIVFDDASSESLMRSVMIKGKK